MLRTILNILLIGAIVTCPLRCLAGLCPSADDCCRSVSSCCQHCKAQEHRADRDPNQPSDAPFEPCRSSDGACICSGALVEAIGSLLTEQVENGHLRHVVPLEPAAVLVATGQRTAHPPDPVMTEPGPRLCILQRALLL